jgi:hypothetical protein
MTMSNIIIMFVPTDERKLRELTGPGSWEQWRHWTYRTSEHKHRIAAKNELERILKPQRVSISMKFKIP